MVGMFFRNKNDMQNFRNSFHEQDYKIFYTQLIVLKFRQHTQIKHCGVLISVIHICLHNLCCMLLLPGGERPMIRNVLGNYSIRYQFARGSPLLIGLTIKLGEAPFLGHINLEKKQELPTSFSKVNISTRAYYIKPVSSLVITAAWKR